jgi:hypothetical protein
VLTQHVFTENLSWARPCPLLEAYQLVLKAFSGLVRGDSYVYMCVVGRISLRAVMRVD